MTNIESLSAGSSVVKRYLITPMNFFEVSATGVGSVSGSLKLTAASFFPFLSSFPLLLLLLLSFGVKLVDFVDLLGSFPFLLLLETGGGTVSATAKESGAWKFVLVLSLPLF